MENVKNKKTRTRFSSSGILISFCVENAKTVQKSGFLSKKIDGFAKLVTFFHVTIPDLFLVFVRNDPQKVSSLSFTRLTDT